MFFHIFIILARFWKDINQVIDDIYPEIIVETLRSLNTLQYNSQHDKYVCCSYEEWLMFVQTQIGRTSLKQEKSDKIVANAHEDLYLILHFNLNMFMKFIIWKIKNFEFNLVYYTNNEY